MAPINDPKTDQIDAGDHSTETTGHTLLSPDDAVLFPRLTIDIPTLPHRSSWSQLDTPPSHLLSLLRTGG